LKGIPIQKFCYKFCEAHSLSLGTKHIVYRLAGVSQNFLWPFSGQGFHSMKVIITF